MEQNEIIKLLIDRLSHLEEILVSTLLVFFITTTLAVFAAVYQSRQLKRREVPQIGPIRLILAVNSLYLVLAGYFYFMLTNFYGSAIVLISVSHQSGFEQLVSSLWSTFELAPLPFLDVATRNMLYLAGAPLLPLFLSMGAVTGVWLLLKGEISHWFLKFIILPLSFLAHLFNFYLLVFTPFARFLEALNL